jgi:pimeloyl-ACP methyl ester carboxylesterase
MHHHFWPARLSAVLPALARALFAALCLGCSSPESESGFADVNGTRLYFEAAGSGQAVVLIHGFSLDASMWDDQFSALAVRRRAIRYDARGFGRSGPIEVTFSTSEDLRALLDDLGVERATVVGISMGGRYAIDFALAYPDRVRAVVAADPGLGGQSLPTIAVELAPAIAAAQGGDLTEAKRIWLQSSLFEVAREQPAAWARIERMVNAYSGWHFVNGLAAQEEPLDPPAATRLGTLSMPVLLVMGERDVPDIRVIADKLVAEVPELERVDIPGAGHFTNLEAASEFNRSLLEFLRRVGG